MPTATGLLTVEEYRALPAPAGGASLELHHGEVVSVTRPKARHYVLQFHLLDLLRSIAGKTHFIGAGMNFGWRMSPR